MNIILNFLSPAYLLNRSLGPSQSKIAYIFAGFCVLIIFFAVILSKLAKNKDLFAKKTAQKFSSFAWTMGLIGIILYTFRQINVLYLSAPVFVLIWGVALVVWLFFIIRYRIFIVPKRRKTLFEQGKKREYIP